MLTGVRYSEALYEDKLCKVFSEGVHAEISY